MLSEQGMPLTVPFNIDSPQRGYKMELLIK